MFVFLKNLHILKAVKVLLLHCYSQAFLFYHITDHHRTGKRIILVYYNFDGIFIVLAIISVSYNTILPTTLI